MLIQFGIGRQKALFLVKKKNLWRVLKLTSIARSIVAAVGLGMSFFLNEWNGNLQHMKNVSSEWDSKSECQVKNQVADVGQQSVILPPKVVLN